MILWLLMIYVYEFLRYRGNRYLKTGIIPIYFSLVLVLAWISLYFFPLSGDEILYDRCGIILSPRMPQDFFIRLAPEDLCSYANGNFFVRFVGLLYSLGSPSYFNLIGFNAFVLFLGIDWVTQSFGLNPERQRALFRKALFFPPLLYLSLRPAKEATMGMMIAAALFVITDSRPWVRVFGGIAVGGLFYLLRWQFAVIFGISVLLLILWEGFIRIRNWAKLLAVTLTGLGLYTGWMRIKDEALAFLFLNYLDPAIIYKRLAEPGGALIYKLMILETGGAKSLQPWNIFVAHVGGLFTPHPLRFLKEYLRDFAFDYQVFEEFLFVSLWFYLLLPLFLIFAHQAVVKNIRRLDLVPRREVFGLIFSLLLFSASCFSLFMETPQSFRYKVPINVYFFTLIAVFVSSKGWPAVKADLRKYRYGLFAYGGLLSVYSLLYLINWR